MEIHGDNYDYVRLTPCGSAHGSSDGSDFDVCLLVEISSSKFTGVAPDVWFHRSDVEQFVTDLERLYERVEGSAVLWSMSPDECMIEVTTVGLARRLIVKSNVRKSEWIYDGRFDQFVSIVFPIEPADLSATAHELRMLLHSGQ